MTKKKKRSIFFDINEPYLPGITVFVSFILITIYALVPMYNKIAENKINERYCLVDSNLTGNIYLCHKPND